MRHFFTTIVAAGLLACQGTIGDPLTPGEAPETPRVAACGASPVRPLRRLTSFEYDNTIADILGDNRRVAAARFVGDEQSAGFRANNASPITDIQLDNYLEAAGDVAAQALARRGAEWLTCDRAASDCVRPFFDALGERLYRRPLEPDELAAFVAMYESARDAHGADDGITLVLEAMLVSPHFLYLPEDGDALSPFQRASRLSYFLWSSPPDDALLAAAESGGLADAQGIAAQIERMLDDDKTRRSFGSFTTQWLGVDAVTKAFKDPDLFPDWTPELAQRMKSEVEDFAAYAMRSGTGSLTTLLSGSVTAGDSAIPLEPSLRAGILTQGAVLATYASASEGSWVHRGLFVRKQLLCDALDDPPADVDTTGGNNASRLDNPSCSGCHRYMDPIGMGFDAFDAIGRYHGDVTASGFVDTATEAPAVGAFTSIPELGRKLAEHPQTATCFATQWLRFASLESTGEQDACAIDDAARAFIASDQDPRALLQSIALSPQVAGVF
jgi:hypothetical protein